MKIKIRTLRNQKFDLEIDKDSKASLIQIEVVRNKILDLLNENSPIIILHWGRILLDDQIISNLGIRENDNIIVVIKNV